MTIAIFTRRLPEDFLGGAEIHAFLTAQALAKRGHRVWVVTGGREDATTKRGGLTVIRLRAFAFPHFLQTLFLPYWRLRFRKRLKRIVSEADIVHAFDLDGILLLSGWKEVGSKLLATVQDYSIICPGGDLLTIGDQPCQCHASMMFRCHRRYEGSVLRRFYSRIAYPIRFAVRSRLCLRLPAVVFISRYVALQFKRVFGKALTGRTAVIGNFIPEPWLRRPIRKGKRFDVLYVGRLEHYKGMDVLLEALAILVKRGLPYQACIVGAGDIEVYRKRVTELGLTANVSFVGEVAYPDIRSFYLQSKVVVVPSIWPEPCGRAVIEGMAIGNVVVASSSGGTSELLTDKKTGFLVPVNNPWALANTIGYALSHYRELYNLRSQARKHVLRHFVPRIVVGQYEEFYRRSIR